jgi:predicted ATPase/class 3 adenylate cyclase
VDSSSLTTFVFTDIEGSSRLWEQHPEAMRPALARHDALLRDAVEANHGEVVKMTGDGMCAVFADPLDAVLGTLALQGALSDSAATAGIPIRARCGVHVGVAERRDHDFFGTAVNRAARIMSAAHGGQVLLSQAVVDLVRDRLPPEARLRDLGSVRLRDLATPERLHQVAHIRGRQDFPALRSLATTPNNLSQQVTSFVGRERELIEVQRMLRDSRLVTLHGAGGIGKTRLSLQVAAEVLDDFPDGVWLVELAPLTDERRIDQAVAAVLGVKEEPGLSLSDALAKHLKEIRTLLILDNCEHVVAACAELVERLLRSSRSARILATSREPLRVAGEAVYPVPALAVPEPEKKVSADALYAYEAVRLFSERATAVMPSFKLTREIADAVIEICRQLDGIPLAIELAAARTRALSAPNIAARLNDRFRLLTTGDRTALPRQQTLRALIDWSYDYLSESERALFRRLAVFAGGWTLEAAEAVCADEVVHKDDVLDLLTALIEKSLVSVDADGSRYRLLETVRQYAWERLQSSTELVAVRTRHLICFLGLAEEARPELTGPKQGEWLTRLASELDNLLAAHAWCDKAEQGAELGLRLVHAVKPYWLQRGQLALGHRVTMEALARVGAQMRDLSRCRGLFDAGQLSYFMGRYDDAQRLLSESLTIAREIDDAPMVARVLQPLGSALLGQGDLTGAQVHLEQALALAIKLQEKRQIATASNQLAQLHRLSGRLDLAESLYQTFITISRELQDRESVAIGLLNLAMVSIGSGSPQAACEMLLEALSIAAETGSRPVGQSAVEISAGLEASRGNWQRTAKLYGAADALNSQTGLHRDPADEAFLAPLIARARSALGSTFADEYAIGTRMDYDTAILATREWLREAWHAREAATDPPSMSSS